MSNIKHNLGGKFERVEVVLPSGPITYFVGGNGPPFLHIHGAGGLRVSAALQELTNWYKVFMPLVPGFDNTPAHEEVNSFPELANLIATFVETEIGVPCPLNGHAFGGRLVTWYSVLHGDKAGQVIVQCPSGFRARERTITDTQYTQRVISHPERVPNENRSKAVVSANRKAGHRYHTPGKGIFKSVYRDQELIDRLNEIDCMMLILQGSQDGVLEPDSVEFLKTQVRRSRLIFVQGAGHLIEIDAPARYVELVRNFLTKEKNFLMDEN